MKIALLESPVHILPEYLQYLIDDGHELIMYGEQHDPQSIDAIVVRSGLRVDADLLSVYPSLRYVLRVGVGIDNIDTDLLTQRNIALINTPGSNSQAVAELTVW